MSTKGIYSQVEKNETSSSSMVPIYYFSKGFQIILVNVCIKNVWILQASILN